MRINAAPADGAANAELTDTLARVLDLPRRDMTIVSGNTSRHKRVRSAGYPALLEARVAALLIPR